MDKTFIFLPNENDAIINNEKDSASAPFYV